MNKSHLMKLMIVILLLVALLIYVECDDSDSNTPFKQETEEGDIV